MKTKFLATKLTGIFFLVLVGTLSNIAQPSKPDDNSKCLDTKFENTCYTSIKSSFNDYVYLKSRPFSSQINTDVNFSILLKKNVQYVFNVCNSQAKSTIELKLYNEKNKLLATSTSDKITFQPEEAGKYYITTSLEKNSSDCCLILCGMLNKYQMPTKSK